MATLIKNGSIQADEWTLVTDQSVLTVDEVKDNTIVPMQFWLTHREALKNITSIGLYLESDDEVELITDDLNMAKVIAINFPKFADGRGYSIARLLRDRYGFEGEVRAVGDVLQDQLFYMSRCGFDAFKMREDRDIEVAIKGLKSFSEAYQDAADRRKPLFRRRAN